MPTPPAGRAPERWHATAETFPPLVDCSANGWPCPGCPGSILICTLVAWPASVGVLVFACVCNSDMCLANPNKSICMPWCGEHHAVWRENQVGEGKSGGLSMSSEPGEASI